jgi:serine/threonine-protein kinase
VVAAKLIDIEAEGRQHIDRYELVAEIASGGMATVFLARLSGVGGFQRFVAIKRLHPHLAHDPEFVQMFLDEARLAAGIHHPNVVPILEVGASDRGYYLVMEYIEGDTLGRLLARSATMRRPFPLTIGLRVIVDMLAGLHAAHELRDDRGQLTDLVHRDVSPQNILVGLDGVSRISDFGVARAESRSSSTRAGQLKGKIAYMAPEQAAGTAIDRRADVFAAGIVLWEVLSGRRLFKAENEVATLGRVLSDKIDSPRVHTPNLPTPLVHVVMKALERDPEQRFANCAQFAEALERAASPSALVRLARPRDVAAFVAEIIGNEIEQQREAVRGWLARSEPSRTSRPLPPAVPGRRTTESAGAMAMPRAEEITAVDGKARTSALPPAPAARRPWLAAATLLAVAVGALATYFALSQAPRTTKTGQAPVTSTPASSAPAAKPSSLVSADAGDSAAPSAQPVDQLQIVPPPVESKRPLDPAVERPKRVSPLEQKPVEKADKKPDQPEDSDDWLRNPYR